MDGMVQEVKEFIDNERLLRPHQKVLVAVSGGVDSIVLAYVLNEIGYEIGIAHANFQLREIASDLDEQLVEKYAQQMKVPFFTSKFDTTKHARESGISIQMAARDLRYSWFDALRKEHSYHFIATGHHTGDLVETILLNFARGTGIAGFRGILPKRGTVVRPLLATHKQHIVEYATDKKLDWREDQSNQSDYYQRNLIRNQVVPLLKQLNPALDDTTLNTAEIIRSVEQQYNQSLDRLRERLFVRDQQHTRILKSEIKEMKPALLTDLLDSFGFSLDQCRSVLHRALEHTGKVFNSTSHTLNIDREEIIISPISQQENELEIYPDTPGIIQINGDKWCLMDYPADSYKIDKAQDVGAFDLDKLEFPLVLRHWQPGDQFIPLGMKHPKKLSDFLIDSKVPLNYKPGIRVLLSGKEIIWVVGYRIDDRYKITEKTTSVLEIKRA